MRDTCDLWPTCGPIVPIAPTCSPHSDLVMPVDLRFPVGAGEGNRTLMTSLEGWGSAIELRPRGGSAARCSVPGPRPLLRRGCSVCWQLVLPRLKGFQLRGTR